MAIFNIYIDDLILQYIKNFAEICYYQVYNE